MFKILKHIFSSFLKKRTIFLGLTTLIFFTVGVFTLLSTTTSAYNKKLNDYKRVSGLQDATINTDFNFFGNAANNGYTKLPNQIYEIKNQNNNKKQLVISTNFVSLSTINKSKATEYANKYILTSDLLNQYYLNNSNSNSLDTLSINVKEKAVAPIYQKTGDQYEKTNKTYSIGHLDNITLDNKNYKLSDVILYHKESDKYVIDFVKDLVINVLTKQATFDSELASKWIQSKIGVKVDSDEVLKLLGLTQTEKNKTKSIEIASSSTSGQTTSNNSQAIAKIVLDDSQQAITFSNTTFHLTKDKTLNSSEFFTFEPNQSLSLDSSWIKNIDSKIEYINHRYKLKQINDPNNFSGFIKQYLTLLKENNPKEFDKIANINYWEKRTTTTTNNVSQFNSSKVSIEDLNTPIYLLDNNSISTEPTTIAKIQKLSSDDILNLTKEQLDELSNANIKDATFLKISEDVHRYANAYFYQQLQQYTQTINGKEQPAIKAIGTREFLTLDLSQKDKKEGQKNQIIQFINAGISPQYFDQIKSLNDNSQGESQTIDLPQQVGRLYDETLKYGNKANSPLFPVASKDNDTSNTKIPPIYAAQIINNIFSGNAVDPNYLNVDVSFITYRDSSTDPTVQIVKTQQKAVLLQQNGTNNITLDKAIVLVSPTQFGVIEKQGNEWILTKILGDVFNPDSSQSKASGNSGVVELAKYLQENNYEISGRIGKDGWLRSNNDFSNTKTVPFIFYAPATDVLNEIQQKKTINLLFKQLANSINNSSIVAQGFFLKPDVDAIAKAFANSARDLDVVSFFTGSNTNYNVLYKWVFKSLQHLINDNRPTIIRDVLINFVDKMIEKTQQQSSVPTQQSLYLVKQLQSLSSFLKIFNVNVFDLLFKSATPEQLSKAITNPIAFLQGIKQIIYSIDFSMFVSKVNQWLETDKISENKVKILTSADILQSLLSSIDSQNFKSGLINIVDNINFEAIISAKVASEGKGFVGFLVQPILNKIAEQKKRDFLTFLEKLNNKQYQHFSNINEGLKNLIINFDLNAFAKNFEMATVTIVENSTKVVTENGQKSQQPIEFVKNQISTNGILVALLTTLFKDEQSKQNTIQQVIKILNISDKVEQAGSQDFGISIFKPAKDDNKIDIFDLQNLSSFLSSGTSLDQIIESLTAKVTINKTLLAKDLTPDENKFVINFLNFNLPGDNRDLAAKLAAFNKVYNLFKIKNFKKNGTGKNALLQNLARLPGAPAFSGLASIGDYYYQLTNATSVKNSSSTDSTSRSIYTIASNELIQKLKSDYSQNPNSIVADAIKTFDFWIRFSIENNLSTQDLRSAFELLYNQATSSTSQLSKQLNLTDLFGQTNLKQADGIIQDFPKPSNSILLPYQTANKLFGDSGILTNFLNSNAIFQKQFKTPTGTSTLAKWLTQNKVALVENLGLLAFYKQHYPFDINFAIAAQQVVEQYLLNTNAPLTELDKTILANLVANFATTNPLVQGLNLSLKGLSTIFAAQLPQVALWFSVNPDAKNATEANAGNLAFILLHRLPNAENLKSATHPSGFIDLFASLKNNLAQQKISEPQQPNFNVDYYYLNWIGKQLSDESQGQFFGISLGNFYYQILNNTLVTKSFYNLVNVNDNRAYVIKINEAFLKANHKEVYTGKIGQTSEEIEQQIASLDPKYILEAAGLKYIIVGTDFTADYLYPVFDEKNLQVDPTNQVLGYVNKWGFDKARYSFRTTPIKSYLLIQLQPGASFSQFKQDVDKMITQNFGESKLERVYGATQVDFLNPERSLRISVATQIINGFQTVNVYLTLFLSILVIFAVAFITKRFISQNNKILGLLRAQGYTLFEIATSFIAISFFISFIGGILGFIVGFFLKIPVINLISGFWEFDVSLFSFEPITFVVSILAPFVILTLLVYATIFWILRQKPSMLLSGMSEVNTSRFAQKIGKTFMKTGVTTKFSISLVVNSIWKLVSLIVSIVLVQFILIFSLSSQNIFNNAINKTYENRHYNYKVNLFTPTREGGPIVPYDPKNVANSLYVPSGDVGEINQSASTYFEPGQATVMGSKHQNGKLKPNQPILISYSSLNLKSGSANGTTIFDIVLGQLPESLKNNIFSISNKVIEQMEQSQNLKVEKRNGVDFVYKGTPPNYQPYFKFIKDQDSDHGRFWYFQYNKKINNYQASEVSIFGGNRNAYRKFLVESYLNPSVNKDFLISFGGIDFDKSKDEVYTYLDTNYSSSSSQESGLKIYGYDVNSKLVSITDENGKNLLKVIDNNFSQNSNEPYPIAVNQVFAKKHGVGIGSIIDLPILNSVNRFTDFINHKKSEKVKFKIVGISNTFINSELITTNTVANKILGLDEFSAALAPYNVKPFNGILIKGGNIDQLTSSFGLYAPSGYWAGQPDIDANKITEDDAAGFFAKIFAFEPKNSNNTGLMQQKNYNKKQIVEVINWNKLNEPQEWKINESTDLSYQNVTSPNFVNQNIGIIRQALQNFNQIYGKSLYQIETQGVEARNIEVNFISNFGSLFGSGINLIVIIFLVVAVIILLIISSSIINENEKNIAILSIIGYSNWTKIKLFFGIYLPIVLIGSLLSVPIVLGAMSIFNNLILASNSIYLALSLTAPIFIAALIIVAIIFTVTLAASWYILNRKKAVMTLKEQD